VGAVDLPKGPPAALSISLIKSVVGGPALWVSLALIVTSVFIYAPVGNHDFVAWDDPDYVSDNMHVAAGVTWDGVRWALTTGHGGNWYPLTWLSYMLDVQFFGMSAGPQLFTNLLFHTLNALLLFGLLHAMTGALGRSAFVSALFVAHPLHVESVAWISERKDVLSTLFGLLALWAYFQCTRRPRRTPYLTVLLFFALSLMAKPMLVTLPLVMLLMDYWPLRRVALHPRYVDLQLVREKLPMLAIALVSCAITFVTQQRAGAVTTLTKVPLDLRAANALASYTAYIGKMLWPWSLSAFYPLFHLTPGVVLGSGMALAVTSLLVIWGAQRHPYLPVGWLWYLGTLVPVIGLIQVGSQSMADRYTYFPLIGLFIILAWGIADLLASWPHQEILLPAGAAIVILVCATTARTQVLSWKDTMTLWTHALEVNADNDVAHYLLGDWLTKQGRLQEAMAHYSEALRLKPDNAEAHDSMGFALASQGRFSDAISQYSEALRLKPAFAAAHCNLGLAMANEGRVEEGIGEISEALRINPDFVEARNNLGIVLANQGKTGEAAAQFSEVVRLKPSNAAAHNNLGILLANQGRLGEAIAHFSEAVRLQPDFAVARNNLQTALTKQGDETRPTR
jgi:Flp pilus assembly protein TadD